MTLILASASAARREMLEAAGVAVEAVPARVDEIAVKAAMLAEEAPPRDIADSLAELKAVRISGRYPGQLVLGADQVLVAGGRVFDKPRDLAEARAHLTTLRGQTHQLLSAAVIARDGAPLWRHIGTVHLVMRPVTDAFLDDYLARSGEAILSSVGAYHLEGLGAQLFARVDGDYFTVLGLPLLEVLGFLRAQGVLLE
ncbi:MAG: Maf family nucleotide pyrophosphatase [Pseudomonadota bacterium]